MRSRWYYLKLKVYKISYAKIFITIEMKNPKSPRIAIPIAETFAIVSYSFLEGFFKECQTLVHLIKNDFVDIANLLTMNRKSAWGF